MSPSFLSKDPISWHDDKDYQAALKVVQNLTEVNDTSERVQLATKYQNIITKDWYQRKCLILGVHEDKKAKLKNTKKQLFK